MTDDRVVMLAERGNDDEWDVLIEPDYDDDGQDLSTSLLTVGAVGSDPESGGATPLDPAKARKIAAGLIAWADKQEAA